jgi:hypothetical protein
VQADHQVAGEMPELTIRTLPSPRPTRMPAERGAVAKRGSQVALPPENVGWTWNFEAGPVTW